jgi:hypothetical protein
MAGDALDAQVGETFDFVVRADGSAGDGAAELDLPTGDDRGPKPEADLEVVERVGCRGFVASGPKAQGCELPITPIILPIT